MTRGSISAGEPAAANTSGGRVRRAAAYAVHIVTASGVVFALLAAIEIASPQCDPRLVFLWFIAATLVDAVDGPLARRLDTKRLAARFDGRTIDDLVDYLTFTFLPLLLVWRMDWLPLPETILPEVIVSLAMAASLFGFANTEAKQEAHGFFLGFPSYWNIVAFYAGLWHAMGGAWINAALFVLLAVLTVTPVRFIYPNLAPRPWKAPLMLGGVLWLGVLLVMLPNYPDGPAWLMWLSLAYPALYVAASVWLDLKARRRERMSRRLAV